MSLFEPDDFRDDWYGYLTNQPAHMALGAFWAFCACIAALVVVGEFPNRLDTWHLILMLFTFFELGKQRWQGWDTIEDICFTVIYGAGMFLYTFREADVGTGDFTGNIWDAAPFVVASATHLAIGTCWRAKRCGAISRAVNKLVTGVKGLP